MFPKRPLQTTIHSKKFLIPYFTETFHLHSLLIKHYSLVKGNGKMTCHNINHVTLS